MRHRLKALLFGAGLTIGVGIADATTVGFDEFTTPVLIGSGTNPNVGLGGTLSSQGFVFTLGKDAVGEVLLGASFDCGPACPYNGTPYVLFQDSGLHTALTIRREDNSAFSFNSFESGESFLGSLFEADRLKVTGTLAGGGTISYLFDLDGVNDGDGPATDFQRFFLPREFANLVALTINGVGGRYADPELTFYRNDFSIDNLVFDEAFGEANGCYPTAEGGATIQTEPFDSAATAAANGWRVYNGEAGWGWQNSGIAGGNPGEARVGTFTAGTQRWYADLDLGGELTFSEDWAASGRMDFNENSVSDGGMFFGFFNRDTSLAAQTQTLAGFLLVNGQLTLRFERRPYNEYAETSDFGLWVNGDRTFTLSYDADGAGPGIGRLTATLTSLADQTTITRSLDINHSLVTGATLNSFGFYAMDFAAGRHTPVGWAVDNLGYGPVPVDCAPQPASFTLSTAVIAGCKSVTGTVKLSGPAPADGVTVTLSDTLAAATTPASFRILPGATTKRFLVKTTPVDAAESGTVSARIGGTTISKPLMIRPVGLTSLTLTPTTVVGSQPVAGKATLECKAGPGPVTVDLASTNAAVANPVAASIVVPQGLQSQPFTVITSPVPSKSYATISGTANGITKSKKLTVNVAAAVSPTSLRFGNVTVGTTSGVLSTTFSNRGAVPYSIASIALGGPSPQVYSRSHNCPASLNAGASCTIEVRFSPTVAAYRSAQLVIATSATSNPLKVLLTGTGVVGP